MTDDEILDRVAALPDISGYPGVDELTARLEDLAARFPHLLSSERIGTSRLGEPLVRYTLAPSADPREDEDPQHCLVVGGVHPNEPIGSHTILHLVAGLLEDESLRTRLNTVWHVIPCVDPDGMRLNEGWFQDPGNDETYFRHFHRPPGDEQVEWTFPINYKAKYFDAMLPETQALQRQIDEIRPDFLVPLHNSETGGAYYYLSQPHAELIPLLHRLPAELGIPLHRGEPESAHFTELAPAVFEAGSAEDVYDWREEHGLDPAPRGGAGQSSTSYARRYGTFSLIAELPIWRTFGADDTRSTGTLYSARLREAGDALRETGERLTALLESVRPHLTLDSPFLRSAAVFVPAMTRTGETMIARSAMPENERPATVAERPMSVVWMYRLRFGGALLRALLAELTAGAAPLLVRRAARELEDEWTGWLAERRAQEQTEEIPVKAVVGVQYGAVLGLVAKGRGHATHSERSTGEARTA